MSVHFIFKTMHNIDSCPNCIGGARPYSSVIREEMESQEQGNCILKDRRPRSGDKSSQFSRTDLVVETKDSSDDSSSCTKSHSVEPKTRAPRENCVSQRQTPGTSSLAKTLSEPKIHPNKHLNSETRLAKSPKGFPQPSKYLTTLTEIFKPERLTKLENKVIRRTTEALEKLSQNIEEARLQEEHLLHDHRLLQQELLYLETENSRFLRFLRKQNDLCKKKHEALWDEYFQKCEKIRHRKRELASRLAQQKADLQAQLFQGMIRQYQLRQQVQSMEHISVVRKKQETRMQTLQQELETIKAETAKKDYQAHVQFLQGKTQLVRQLQELTLLQAAGDSSTREVKYKVQALESTAKKVNSEFCDSVSREDQELQEELVTLVQEYHKLESAKRQLEKRKEHLREERWYQDALARGRGHLLANSGRSQDCNPCPKGKRVPRLP
ncbi:coiled-coil domain-containing protein 121 [Acomys russatus]|uniref:coiled-coil domain-containing protein 121 n=1 Tax=Acomys russatus TaxID=60746 RepID=UPI0021E2C867|nr:coiled-coil domain-containing protein 121 [Acomys russatus]